jgi:hypothetical protein
MLPDAGPCPQACAAAVNLHLPPTTSIISSVHTDTAQWTKCSHARQRRQAASSPRANDPRCAFLATSSRARRPRLLRGTRALAPEQLSMPHFCYITATAAYWHFVSFLYRSPTRAPDSLEAPRPKAPPIVPSHPWHARHVHAVRR